MKMLLSLLVLVSLFGCKIVSCPTADRIANAAAMKISAVAACKNQEAIREDLTKFLGGETCNKPAPTGPLAMFACPILARLVTNAAWKAVPERWECEGGNAKLAIQSALTVGCNLIPF